MRGVAVNWGLAQFCQRMWKVNTAYGRLSLFMNSHNWKRSMYVGRILNVPVRVKMPSLSPTMTEGSIVKWNKKEGEDVSSGDVLCEVQTDKAVVALECEEDGVLAKIIVAENTPNIQVGDLIAIIANPDEDWKKIAASELAAQTVPSPDQSKPKASPAESISPVSHARPAETTLSAEAGARPPSTVGPAVRLLLQSHGLNATNIPASGPRGQLLKGDVLSYLAAHPSVTATPAPLTQTPVTTTPSPVITSSSAPTFTDIPISNIRQVISKRLTQSKSTIPHAYVRAVAKMDKVMQLRKALKSHTGLKVSINDMIIKSCALGLRVSFWLIFDSYVDISACIYVHYRFESCKTAGPDDLVPPLFKGGEALAEALTHLFQLVWTTETIPSSWGHSMIVPIFKKDIRGSCENHRN
ncbi:hypothetical protein P879_09306 [Paragonimus westermani]|uniref:Dihydrolipoamide acetyltransferase component of pyruvate dehydrogenase complex n=1 Tax=Paragonimus westermani TaxID=34504 RepID=A0A8T0DGH2_9TREM|nr:hypothetical protein P879_09306 [Paragonimus westermani]